MLGLRFGLAAIVAAAAAAGGVGLAACGSITVNPSTSGGTGDGGTEFMDSSATLDSPSIVADGPSFDANPDAAVETGALFVHASPNMQDLRLCWWVSSDGGDPGPSGNVAPFPSGAPAPMSDYPSIPIGAAVPLPDASSLLGGDLTIQAFPAADAIDPAGQVPPSCFDRLAGTGSSRLPSMTPIYEFHVPAGAVVAGATNVLALAGCAKGDSSVAPARCGSGFSVATGNLHVDVIPLHEVNFVPTGQLAVQTAQLSPALAVQLGDAGAVVSFGPQDAAAPLATLASEGAFAPSAAAFLNIANPPTDYARLGFAIDFPLAPDAGAHSWLSLEQSLELLDPSMNPATYYAQHTTYVVAVVGDTAGAPPFTPEAGTYDGTGLHVLVLPLP